ncbi:FFAR2 protein, partial [Odontophorus gujanensis]|nr:FFAR2 protein [Odontophorus gujanensis]
SLPPAMLILIVHALTFAVGLPANVFTIATLLAKIRRHRPRPHLTAADLLLLHLTTADLLLLLFLPFKMAEAAAGMEWPFPTVLCPIANFCFFSSIYLSTLFMAALGVERYFGVAHPHRYGRRRRLWRTAVASAVLWVLALSHCSVVFVAEYHRNPTETQPHSAFRCYDDFSAAQLRFVLPLRLELCLVLYLLPFAVTVFCYVRLIRALLPRPHIPREKKYRTVGLAVATVVNFGVCFAPYNLSHVVGFVQQRSPEWRPYALILTTLSAALDPFIFYFSSSAVRMAVGGVVGAVRGQ